MRAVMPKKKYPRPVDASAHTIGVWIHVDDEDYVEAVARDLGISKNKAFKVIISEHREWVNGKHRVRP